MKYIYSLLLLVIISATTAHGDQTNILSSQVMHASLAEVRAAIDSYCTNSQTDVFRSSFVPFHNDLNSTERDYIPGVRYRLFLGDCHVPMVGNTEILATSVTETKTRLDVISRHHPKDARETQFLRHYVPKLADGIAHQLKAKGKS